MASAVKEIEDDIGTTIQPVVWLPGFFSLPASVKIRGSKAFQNGDIYGMDIASAVAVHALDVQPNDHVLDLCCAPGGKMCDDESVVGTVTGIATCRSILRKYKVRRARLFLLDVRRNKFNVYAPSRVGKWLRNPPVLEASAINITEPKEGAFTPFLQPFHVTRLLAGDPQIQSNPSLLYDKVLVDAECTHDGSISHLEKCIKEGWDRFEERYQGSTSIEELEILQVLNLKPGGILVYSTCSQNEDIVIWLLETERERAILEVPVSTVLPAFSVDDPFEMRHTLRFTPSASRTSGLFVARIRKSFSEC
ncbi:S-adenosyl-L-methionine-dependent methyltransferase [Chytridium lagenaria]|nr:S-adenosyl-L-methionine-dependent methyltransferase [Chytridium lagenaria]